MWFRKYRGFWKELAIVLLIIAVIDLLFYFGLKKYYSGHFSRQKIEELVTKNSKFKEVTDDPCKWSILGDPWGAANTYLKLGLSCSKDHEVSNTLDLSGIKGKTFADLLREYARMQGINSIDINEGGQLKRIGSLSSTGINSWICFVNYAEASDLNRAFKGKDELDCFYGDVSRLSNVRTEMSKRKNE